MIGTWNAATPGPGDPPLSSQLATPGMPGARSIFGHQLVEAVHRRLLERDDDQVAALGVLEQRREHLGVLDVLGVGLGRRAALDLDVDRRAREGAHHLTQSGHSEVGGAEALGRLAVAGGDAAEAVGLAPQVVAVVVTRARREPVGGVEALEAPEA